ncbi:hypothetical protein ANAEL_03052 [Anaerolineales bacterium]|nr:hypothetical protein ANAEL_03052 [Anaerolineales bacterium]
MLVILGIYFSIKRIKKPASPEKIETTSRYLVQAPLWCLLALFAVELTLRVTVYSPPLRRDVTNWAGDIPGVHTFILWGKEGYGLTRYDKWGALQTPFHDNKKDNNVIVLGDSQTECLQVPDNQKFTSVAETLLRRDGYDADLHNLGRSGLAMADYVSWIPPYRDIYRPRAIVVQLTTSDFIESFQEGQFNYFVIGDDHELDLAQTYDLSAGFIQKARRKYRFGFQIGELGYQRWYLMRNSSGRDQNIPAGGNPSTGTVNLQRLPTVPGEEQNVDVGVFDLALADRQLKLLLRASEGVPLIVVFLPSAPYISGNEIEMTDPAHERLMEFMKRYPEVTVVDPLPEFQNLTMAGRLPRGFFNSTPGSGHLNQDGNQIVGELLAQAIGQVLK